MVAALDLMYAKLFSSVPGPSRPYPIAVRRQLLCLADLIKLRRLAEVERWRAGTVKAPARALLQMQVGLAVAL